MWILMDLYELFRNYMLRTEAYRLIFATIPLTIGSLFVIFLAICCQNIEIMMTKIITKLNEIDDKILNCKECQDAAKSLYNQIIFQPINIIGPGNKKITKIYIINVMKSLLSYITLLIQFQKKFKPKFKKKNNFQVNSQQKS
ncbi:unnamed protein product [Chironomus riparius]|uniref:Transmembrane protein n=1 Tax=Chironomus riparius TaxID=315576 RepID=A0A9N9RZJ0_9DIPT|nr:unnamed protein product [Chironomus riparius]